MFTRPEHSPDSRQRAEIPGSEFAILNAPDNCRSRHLFLMRAGTFRSIEGLFHQSFAFPGILLETHEGLRVVFWHDSPSQYLGFDAFRGDLPVLADQDIAQCFSGWGNNAIKSG